MLATRKTEVVLVREKEETWVRTEGRDIDIEALIVPKCIELHQQRMVEGKVIEHSKKVQTVQE